MTSEGTSWRLILDPALPGAENMAIDESILEAVSAGEAPPTLRLYRWEPACLSLGYGQRYREVDEEGLWAHGWDVVRRPTGGKAILHVDELTYAVAAPIDHPVMRGGVLPSYRRIAAALLAGLEGLAVAVTAQARYDREPGESGPVCFEVPSDWEITWEGRKLVGSAQVRRKNGVLQHGTIPLHGDLGRITAALAFDSEAARDEAAERVRERAASVETALGRRVDWEEAGAAVGAGFAISQGIAVKPCGLTEKETAAVVRLREEKYGNAAWTRRRA